MTQSARDPTRSCASVAKHLAEALLLVRPQLHPSLQVDVQTLVGLQGSTSMQWSMNKVMS